MKYKIFTNLMRYNKNDELKFSIILKNFPTITILYCCTQPDLMSTTCIFDQ